MIGSCNYHFKSNITKYAEICFGRNLPKLQSANVFGSLYIKVARLCYELNKISYINKGLYFAL
jgi:hypothetical protein